MTEEKKNKKIFTILIVVLLILLGGAAFWIFRLSTNPTPEAVDKFGPVYETEEFTVNLSESVKHFAKAKFALELSEEKVAEELEEKLPILQDTIIMVLSKQSLETLSTVEGKEALKTSLIKEINEFLNGGHVTKIYYKTFIFS